MESEHAYAFLDINPMNRYHTLIIPRQHYTDIFDIPERELQEVIALVRKVALLYEEKLGIRNIQIISNSGAEAQQDVFHLHFHIAPRHRGDGQQIHWNTHTEYRQEFDAMLEALK